MLHTVYIDYIEAARSVRLASTTCDEGASLDCPLLGIKQRCYVHLLCRTPLYSDGERAGSLAMFVAVEERTAVAVDTDVLRTAYIQS